MDKKATRPHIFLWLSVLVFFAPLALLAALLSPNDYIAQGIEGSVDCDGPLTVMLFAIPSCLIYGIAAASFSILAFRRKSWSYGIFALLCFLIVAIVIPNMIGAYSEHSSLLHKITCGEKW